MRKKLNPKQRKNLAADIQYYQGQGEAAMKREKNLAMAQKVVRGVAIGAALGAGAAYGVSAVRGAKPPMAKPVGPGSIKIIPRDAMGRSPMGYGADLAVGGGAGTKIVADYIKKKYGNTKVGKAVGAVKRAWTE